MENLSKIFPDIKKDIKLASFSSFSVGGEADFFYEANVLERLKKILDYTRKNKINVFLFGGGTNIIFSDEGYRGLVIKNNCSEIKIEGEDVYVESGAKLPILISEALKQNLSGLENLVGIPGSVGGAVFGNSGAYGIEIGNFVNNAVAFSKDGIKNIKIEKERDFSYRNSRFKQKNELVLELYIKLRKSKEGIKINKNLLEARRNQDYKNSAGCFFKNPSADNPAGKLLDEIGAKGMNYGNAKVSERHANFIINTGNARTKDILSLSRILQEKVKEKFGIKLETEVQVVDPNLSFFNF